MGWIRIDGGLTWHRKLIDLRARLNEPLAEAYLQRLWLWCHDNAPEGVVLGLDPASAIEVATQWEGEAGALAEALIASGFLERSANGDLRIHDWEEHNGKHIKKAKADAKRAKKTREAFKKKAKAAYANGSRTKAKQSVHESGNETGRDGTRRDETVVYKQLPAAPPLPPPDQRVTGKELRELWNASLADGSKRPRWEEFSAPQEMQADAAGLAFDRGKWLKFFDVLHVSAVLNGFASKGIPLTPRRLLTEPTRWVEGALNGEFSGAADLAQGQAPVVACIAGCSRPVVHGELCAAHLAQLQGAAERRGLDWEKSIRSPERVLELLGMQEQEELNP